MTSASVWRTPDSCTSFHGKSAFIFRIDNGGVDMAKRLVVVMIVLIICPHMIFDIYGEMTVVNKTERTEIRMPIDDGKIWNSNGTVTRLQISMYDGNFSIRIPDESKESFTEYDVLYRGTYHMEKKDLILDMPDGGRIVMQQMTVAE